MAFTLLSKRSNATGHVPTTVQLQQGELSVNTYDGLLFFVKSQAGSNQIVTLGPVPQTANALTTARSIAHSGDATGAANFNGSADITIPLTLAATGVTAGTFNQFAVDAKGRVTSARTLSSADVTGALTYTPASLINPSFTGTVTASGTIIGSNVTANNKDYVIGITQPGLAGNAQLLVLHTLPHGVALPAGMAGSTGKARTAATASTVFTLAYVRAGTTTTICTFTFAASGTTATIGSVAIPTLAAGDDLLLTGPATADSTLADIGFSILAAKT